MTSDGVLLILSAVACAYCYYKGWKQGKGTEKPKDKAKDKKD